MEKSYNSNLWKQSYWRTMRKFLFKYLLLIQKVIMYIASNYLKYKGLWRTKMVLNIDGQFLLDTL